MRRDPNGSVGTLLCLVCHTLGAWSRAQQAAGNADSRPARSSRHQIAQQLLHLTDVTWLNDFDNVRRDCLPPTSRPQSAADWPQ